MAHASAFSVPIRVREAHRVMQDIGLRTSAPTSITGGAFNRSATAISRRRSPSPSSSPGFLRFQSLREDSHVAVLLAAIEISFIKDKAATRLG